MHSSHQKEGEDHASEVASRSKSAGDDASAGDKAAHGCPLSSSVQVGFAEMTTRPATSICSKARIGTANLNDDIANDGGSALTPACELELKADEEGDEKVVSESESDRDCITASIARLEDRSLGLATASSTSEGTTSTTIAAATIITNKVRRKRALHFVALCACFFLEGWNDGSTGPILPRIQSKYGVNYAVLSLLWVFQSVGFLIGALLNVHLTDRLGFGKVITFATALQSVPYVVQICAPPFPVWLLSFGIYGVFTALQTGQMNAFGAALNDPSKMSILHACYGTGALLSPLVATQFAQLKHFSFHYLTALGVSVSTTVLLLVAFRLRNTNDLLVESGFPPGAANADKSHNSYRQIWSRRVVHLLALFILVYTGLELTIGGWSVTYVIHRAHGGPSSGYVSSGFYGGLAAGRIVLIPVTKWIGPQRAIFVYSFFCIGLEILMWALPLLIPTALCISLVGLFLGPMFPLIINQCGVFIPAHLLAGAIGWIASFGMLGTALFPLMTGALANRFGVVSLVPLVIIMTTLMASVWAYVLYVHRRDTRALAARDRTEAEDSVEKKSVTTIPAVTVDLPSLSVP